MGLRYVAYVDVHRRTAHRRIVPAHGAPALAVDERVDVLIRAGRGSIVDLAVTERSVDEAGVESRDVDVGMLLGDSEIRECFGYEVYVEGQRAWLERVFPRQEAACCCCARTFSDLI